MRLARTGQPITRLPGYRQRHGLAVLPRDLRNFDQPRDVVAQSDEAPMNELIYLVGLVVVVMFILGVLGLR